MTQAGRISLGSMDYEGMGEFLRTSPDLADALHKVADRGLEIAKGLAPVGKPPQDEHAGRYLEMLHTTEGLSDVGDRQAARIVAGAPESAAVEWGNRNIEARHVLLNTKHALEGGV